MIGKLLKSKRFFDFFKNSAFYTISDFFKIFVGFLINLILIRSFSPSIYGVWAIIISFSLFVQAFFSFKMQEAFSKYLFKYQLESQEKLLHLFRATFFLNFLSQSFLPLLTYLICLKFFHTRFFPSNQQAAFIYSFILLFGFLEPIYFSILRDRKKMLLFSITSMILQFFLLGIIFSLFKMNLLTLYCIAWTYLFYRFLTFLITFSQVFYLIKKYYQKYFSSKNPFIGFFKWSILKDFGFFLKYSYFLNFLNNLLKNGDVLLMSLLTSKANVGLYKLAKSLSSIFINFFLNFNKILFHDLNQIMAEKNIKQFFLYVKKLSPFWVLILGVFYGFSFLFFEQVIYFLYGSAYTKSFTYFLLLFPGYLGYLVIFWISPMMYVLERMKDLFFSALGNLIFFFIHSSLLFWAFGDKGLVVSFGVNVFFYFFLLWLRLIFLIKKKMILF